MSHLSNFASQPTRTATANLPAPPHNSRRQHRPSTTSAGASCERTTPPHLRRHRTKRDRIHVVAAVMTGGGERFMDAAFQSSRRTVDGSVCTNPCTPPMTASTVRRRPWSTAASPRAGMGDRDRLEPSPLQPGRTSKRTSAFVGAVPRTGPPLVWSDACSRRSSGEGQTVASCARVCI